MQESEILFGLNEVEGIGWQTIHKICAAGLMTGHIFDLGSQDWENIGLKSSVAVKLATTFTENWIVKRRALMEESGVAMLTVLDEDYPSLLKETSQPPWVIYYRGRLELISRPSIAMVGTRVPTSYGRKVGAGLAEELSDAGLTVVSGLARGIDSVCHEAALARRGGTIAVVATGMDRVYPPENKELQRRIARDGLVISEYPIGTKSHPGLFPQRNRIIAGLSLGTVVVEADSRSGSLITTDAALEADRDVYAVPGPITSPKSQGALELIKQGAKLVTTSADILEEYSSYLLKLPPFIAEKDSTILSQKDSIFEKKLTSEESQLYHILHQGPFTLDELLTRSRWDFGHLHSVLLSLIIKKAVTQLPGAIYKVI